MCDYQCTSVSFIILSNRIEKSIRQRESNRIIFPRIGMLYCSVLRLSWRDVTTMGCDSCVSSTSAKLRLDSLKAGRSMEAIELSLQFDGGF